MLLWLIPFCTRICIGQISIADQETNTYSSTIDSIFQACSSGDTFQAFILIFENNLLCCISNILNGFLLGVGTIVNLSANGFLSADMFVSCYQTMSITDMLRTTLPHSFEMFGVWLSGGIGFMIAWQIKKFAFDNEIVDMKFVKRTGIYIGIVTLLILCAAFVEAYVSMNILG